MQCGMQDNSPNGALAASRPRPPADTAAEHAVPEQVWQLCGVSASLQATELGCASDALRQLDQVQCPLEVVSCLHRTDEAITQAVGKVR